MIDMYTQNNDHNVIMGLFSSVISLWSSNNNETIIRKLVMASLLFAYHNVFSPVKISRYYVMVVFAGLDLFWVQHNQFGLLLSAKI